MHTGPCTQVPVHGSLYTAWMTSIPAPRSLTAPLSTRIPRPGVSTPSGHTFRAHLQGTPSGHGKPSRGKSVAGSHAMAIKDDKVVIGPQEGLLLTGSPYTLRAIPSPGCMRNRGILYKPDGRWWRHAMYVPKIALELHHALGLAIPAPIHTDMRISSLILPTPACPRLRSCHDILTNIPWKKTPPPEHPNEPLV